MRSRAASSSASRNWRLPSRRPGRTSACCCSGSSRRTKPRRALPKPTSWRRRTRRSSRLLALNESRQGNLAASIGHWRRAMALDPSDLDAPYALALELERQGGVERRGASAARDAGRPLRQPRGPHRVGPPRREARRRGSAAPGHRRARRAILRVARRREGAAAGGARRRRPEIPSSAATVDRLSQERPDPRARVPCRARRRQHAARRSRRAADATRRAPEPAAAGGAARRQDHVRGRAGRHRGGRRRGRSPHGSRATDRRCS